MRIYGRNNAGLSRLRRNVAVYEVFGLDVEAVHRQ
jgi:hypothetical protein